VLKDIWIDHDRTREGAILAQLYDEADDEDKKLVKQYFLTTVCHGDVWRELNAIDDTEQGLMRGLKAAVDNFELQRKKLVISKQAAAPGSQKLRATSRLHVPHPSLKYAHKIHYRIVFEEKGTTIDLIPSLPDVITILTGTVTGAILSDHTHL
jgi:Fungal protein kinase